jgi:hypothetical protein
MSINVIREVTVEIKIYIHVAKQKAELLAGSGIKVGILLMNF